jgi:RNA polymerase sigma factor (sigma-70 family)
MSGKDDTGDESLHAQVIAARRGSERAWTQLVTAWSPMIRRVAAGYRLNAHDVDDVVQMTWLRAYRHIGTLNAPCSFPAWLATIARRSALRTLQHGTREILVDEPEAPASASAPSVEDELLQRERETALHGAIDRLPLRQRDLLRAMLASPAQDYRSIAAIVSLPIGSIGPTRGRSIARLQRDRLLAEALAGDPVQTSAA